MARGIETLWFLRSMMHISKYGRFAWMLWSHKAARWYAFLTAPLGLLGLILLAPGSVAAQYLLAAVIFGLAVGALAVASGVGVGLLLPGTRKEDELFGSARDRLVSEAKETAQEVGQTVKSTAQEAGEKVRETTIH